MRLFSFLELPASISKHSQNLVKGLFQFAVSQSGAASNQWLWIPLEQSLQKLQTIAKEMNCPQKDNKALVKCLKSKDALELTAAEEKLFNVCKCYLLKVQKTFFSCE